MISLNEYLAELSPNQQKQIAEKFFLILDEIKNQPVKPAVGVGVTQIVGSDRYPYTIVEVINNRKIIITADDVSPNKKHEPEQAYDYTPRPDRPRFTLTLRKGNRWRELGDTLNGTPWHVGSRRFYQDPSF
jgi:hypothetical protein